MTTTFVASTSLTTIQCGECGGTYAIQERYRAQRQEAGDGWNCPYCKCQWGYYGETEAQRLRRQLVQSQNSVVAERQRHDQTRADLRETELRRIAQKGVTTRIKNRITKGVCPCCNRTFQDLQRHMAGKHPNYAATE
jgi:hypothetical protein